MKYRHRVLGLLALLAVITYLDRVAISVAGPRIRKRSRSGLLPIAAMLAMGAVGWLWVDATQEIVAEAQ